MTMMNASNDPERLAARFEQDGFVYLRQALGEDDLTLLETIFAERLADQANVARLYAEDPTIVQAHAVSIDTPNIARFIAGSPLADLAQQLFRGQNLWYWSEQAWLKEGGYARRTAWHQDLSYVPFAGPSFGVFWIPLESLSAANVLEVVRGSHRTTLYNGSAFDPLDDTAPVFSDDARPRLPDIERERWRWDIVSEPMARGDVLAFHPAALHGGAAVDVGGRRRTMSFRFFADDVVYRPLPIVQDSDLARVQTERSDGLTPGLERLRPGDPIARSGAYRRIRGTTHVR